MSVPAGRNNPVGYAPWRPQAEARRVLDAVHGVLEDYAEQLPLTVRQMFYALVARGVIPKDERAYERLGYVLGRARRARMLPFHTLRDDGEVTVPDATFDSVAGFWDDAVQRADDYRRDRQAGQHFRLELWCEAAGMVPQLHRVAREYSVPVYSSGGFLSLTSVKRIADRVFLWNMTVLIQDKPYVGTDEGQILDTARLRRVMTYYQAVSDLGGDSFGNGVSPKSKDISIEVEE